MKNKTILFGLSGIMFLVLAASLASACSCIYLPDAKAKYDNAAFVFSGKIINQDNLESYPVLQRATFEIEKYWKLPEGFSPKKQIILEAHEDTGANCGYNLQNGEEYLIYAYLNPETGKISTTSCMGSMLKENAENEIAELNELTQGTDPVRIPQNNTDDNQNNNQEQSFFSKIASWFRSLFS